MRLVCAMSGGVDSSVAAALLVDAGHEVIGMTMRLYDARPQSSRGRGGTCCSPAEIDEARRVCATLAIPHYVVDERERFAAQVIEPFAADYAAGRTPNPCTRCNQHVKFGPLLARARALGATRLATGHYARNDEGRLLRAVDSTKDQSYFLFAMGQAALDAVVFPLGTWTKTEVRDRARALGLANAETPDSQELCFVPDGNHGNVVLERLGASGASIDALAPGPVVDVEGRQIGTHEGIHRVTVGQRRGLRVPGTDRRYVLQVLPATRTVVVGSVDQAVSRTLVVDELQRLALADGTHRLEVQVRHRGRAAPATVVVADERAEVVFDAPMRGVAPGQAAVFFADQQVVGGGWITR